MDKIDRQKIKFGIESFVKHSSGLQFGVVRASRLNINEKKDIASANMVITINGERISSERQAFNVSGIWHWINALSNNA